MNLRSKFELSYKQDKNKSTVIILVLLSLVVFVIFSFSKTINYYVEKTIFENFDYNYYFGGLLDYDIDYPNFRESMDMLKEVKYVKDVFSTEESEYIVDVDSVGDRQINGLVRLVGLTEDDLKEISNGNYKDKYSIICHKNYYPDTDHDVNVWIPRSKLIAMDKYKGSTMNIHYMQLTTRKIFYEKLNIVEIVDNDDIQVDENVCFASRELMWGIYQNQFDGINGDDFWESFLVDYDIEHYEEVNEEFNKLGFHVSNESRYLLDEYTLPDFLIKLKFTLLIISILVVGIFISVFNKNKMMDKVKSYSILKTLGMNDKEYNNLLNLESVNIVVKSFIFSIISSLVIYLIVRIIKYYYPLFLMKIYFLFDWWVLVLYYLVVLILLCLTNYLYFKKIKRKSIVENLGD